MYIVYSGASPTFIAAQNGHADALEVLAKHRADLNLANNNGNNY